jgi:hypothetical protein
MLGLVFLVECGLVEAKKLIFFFTRQKIGNPERRSTLAADKYWSWVAE